MSKNKVIQMPGIISREDVLTVAQTLDAALMKDPPYVFTVINDKGSYKEVTSRERYLEHYLDWAMHVLYGLTDIEK